MLVFERDGVRQHLDRTATGDLEAHEVDEVVEFA